jgi:23S rRNA maturation-related 3'-5' exoribonuclease YhaM
MDIIDITARYHALFYMISDTDLREMVCRATPAYFFQCPGAMKHHHAHRHGLLLHTVEVTEVALSMYECNVDLTSQQGIDIMIVAGLLHDVAKCKEYVIASNDVITYGSFTIGHVLESVMWMYRASAGLIEDETLTKIADVMLAHHGYAEWGTPQRQDITRLERDGNPKATMMQCILHSADMVSAENTDMPERVKNLLK